MNPPKASTSARCASGCPSDWCACWPWIATSISPSSFNCASVAGLPLIQARLLPCASSTRRRSTSSPSAASACSRSHALAAGASAIAKLGRELGTLGAGADLPHLEAVAEQQPERVEQDRLAGAGFAGEDGQALGELDVERCDDDEVADRKRAQHLTRPSRTIRSGVALQCSFSRSVAK